MKRIPLEDDYNDILAKAQRGLGLSDQTIAEQAGFSAAEWEALKGGNFDERLVRRVAPVLGLGADSLVALGTRSWQPREAGEIPGLAQFNTTYGLITVNSYLVWDPRSDNAVCFDTGAEAGDMLRFAAERELRIQMVLLTHTHPDHIADLKHLTQQTEAKAFASKLEPLAGAETFEPGRNFRVGSLIIETRATSGHSRGGTTYVVRGLPRLLAMVGDALFAGSMGGGTVSYGDALKNNCEQIFSLPEDTVLCPGHGPLTSVGEEKGHNPFFPQYQAVSAVTG